jgi:hypothetical protein
MEKPRQPALADDQSPSQRITDQIAALADWRGSLFARLRRIILVSAPGMCEEWKWDTAVWSQDGLVCSAAAFKNHVKLNFFRGASLEDPHGLFNAGLDGKASRAIDFNETDEVRVSALKDLIRAAVDYNRSMKKETSWDRPI